MSRHEEQRYALISDLVDSTETAQNNDRVYIEELKRSFRFIQGSIAIHNGSTTLEQISEIDNGRWEVNKFLSSEIGTVTILSIPNGSSASEDITIAGASIDSINMIAIKSALPTGVYVTTKQVIGTDTVRIVVENQTGVEVTNLVVDIEVLMQGASVPAIPVLASGMITEITDDNGGTAFDITVGPNATVDWGDGNTSIAGAGTGLKIVNHTYTSPGSYIVTITTPESSMLFNGQISASGVYLSDVSQFGNQPFDRLSLHGIQSTSITATDTPIFNAGADIGSLFSNSTFNGNISTWNTTGVDNMSGAFQASPFNQDISSWDTSSVTNMSVMFQNNGIFNQDISSWNTSSVTNILMMFANASSFNQNLSGWDVSSVTTSTWYDNGASAWLPANKPSV